MIDILETRFSGLFVLGPWRICERKCEHYLQLSRGLQPFFVRCKQTSLLQGFIFKLLDDAVVECMVMPV